MPSIPDSLRTTAVWATTAWLVLSSVGDLVLLNVAVVTGRLAGPDGVDLFTGAAWIAGVLSAVVLLTAGLCVRRLDRVLVVLLVWGSALAAAFVALRLASTSGSGPAPTSVGMIPRLLLALTALAVVLALRRADARTADASTVREA